VAAAEKPSILFLCTGNSCRSQMAEGWARHLHAASLEAHSAGTSPHGMNPLAIRAMAEAGVDISRHHSKTVDALQGITFDYIITVCDSAHESCPFFPASVRIIHAGFDDPPRLAKDASSDEEAMQHYRRVRDQIRAYIQTLPQALVSSAPARHHSVPSTRP
jgi:arsenate reductase